MQIIVKDSDVIFLRIPRELWRSAGICHCPFCKGAEGFWDTLAVPMRSTKGTHAWTVHMPEAEIRAYRTAPTE